MDPRNSLNFSLCALTLIIMVVVVAGCREGGRGIDRALHFVMTHNKNELQSILNEIDVNTPIRSINKIIDERTLLHWAMELPLNISTVSLLLEAGANVNSVDGRGETPCLLLVKNSKSTPISESILIMLAEHNADLNYCGTDGETIIHKIARNSEHGYLEALVTAQAKFDINLKNCEGETPLKIAVRNNNRRLVEALAKLGGTE